jgi:transposase
MESRSPRRYDETFKQEAVRLVKEGGKSCASVERDLGMAPGLLYKWVRLFEKNPKHPFPGKGHLSPQDEEMRRLRRENEILREERDILKKAVAIFSKTPKQNIGL